MTISFKLFIILSIFIYLIGTVFGMIFFAKKWVGKTESSLLFFKDGKIVKKSDYFDDDFYKQDKMMFYDNTPIDAMTLTDDNGELDYVILFYKETALEHCLEQFEELGIEVEE